jgi:limonene-1,2-epoxide hydrolase
VAGRERRLAQLLLILLPLFLSSCLEVAMSHDQTEANLELVLDWMDALRRNDIDSLADRFHPEVIWVDVAGSIACRGRDELLAWLRASPAHPHQVDALELIADEHHVVLGVHDETREELAGVVLHGQLFTVFTVEEAQIVQLRDFARRAEALAEGGRGDHQWR